jgi:hypothetical protein
VSRESKVAIYRLWVLAVLAVLISAALVRPPRRRPNSDIAMFLLGYTNGPSGCMAIFQVTNRTSRGFCCEVGARGVEKSNGALAWHMHAPSRGRTGHEPLARISFSRRIAHHLHGGTAERSLR